MGAYSLPRLKILKKVVPWQVRSWMRRAQRQVEHGTLALRRLRDFGSLRRLKPVNSDFGWSRGQCIDRYYIEQFLEAYAADIRGHVLEFQTDVYTRRFGTGRVKRCDVLDLFSDNRRATIIADLTNARACSLWQF